MDIISDIVPLLDPIQDHAFGDRNHLGQDLVQDADNSAFVAVIGAGIDDEREKLVRQFIFVGKKL